MSEKSISIIIRAKNAMAAGLSSAGKALQSFGSGVLKVGKWMTVGFLAGVTALAGFAAKASAAYAVQEGAARSLAAALDAQGQSAKKLLPLLEKIASAIQDETGVSDESTLSGMAKMRMLGVQTSKLGEAARAVIALKGVGLEEAAAQKAVAMAMQGNYDMLKRYVPALRGATSETEKAQIVNDLFTKGYAQQKNLLNTVSGQWAALRGRLGDMWEEIGRGIASNEGLMRVLRRAGDAVKAFGMRINEWVNSEKFKAVAMSIEGIIAAIANGGEDRTKALGVVGEVLMASLARGAEVAVETLKAAAPTIGKLIGAAARIAWETLAGASGNDRQVAIVKLQDQGKIGKPWGTAAEEKLVEAAAKEVQHARLMKEYGLDGIKNIEGKTEAQLRLDKALERAGKLGEEWAAKEKLRSDAAAKAAADAAAKSSAKAEEKIKDIVKETAVVKSETEKQKAVREKTDLQNHKDFLERVQKEKAAVEELAKTRVQAVLDAAKAAKDEAKSQEKDDAKAARLNAFTGPGKRLGKKQQEWLDAYNKIAAAKATYSEMGKKESAAAFEIQKREDAAALVRQQEDSRNLKNISDSIDEALAYAE